MSPLQLLLVAAAGAAGALLRHEATAHPDRARAVRATAVLNVLGAGALGVASVVLDDRALLVVGGGLLGSATTFSTWMVQVDGAPSRGSRRAVAVVPLALGVAAAAAGRLLAIGTGIAA